MYFNDTISAISTAVGNAGIGIIRLSGKNSVEVADKIFLSPSHETLQNISGRKIVFGHILDTDGEVLDEVIILIMRAPKSYTCEDVVEIQCHGGTEVLRNILRRTFEAGARPAERGEFTKRAYLNGRLDISQAQAVMDVIQAKTSTALKVAQTQLAGKSAENFQELRQKILELVAHIEALIDFPEDEIDELVEQEILTKIDAQLEKISVLQDNQAKGKILREGLETVIVGKPNVGKSSLLNFLTDTERAIVTEIPGTTRDTIEEFINVEGIPIKIIDTAGIRNSDNLVEKIGIDKTKNLIDKAQLVLALFDSSTALTEEDFEIFDLIKNKTALILLTKKDLPQKISVTEIEKISAKKIIPISAKTGDGIKILEQNIFELVGAIDFENIFIPTEREGNILRKVAEHLQAAKNSVANHLGIDFVSIDLTAALENLSELTGGNVTDDIVDKIFSTFCVGK